MALFLPGPDGGFVGRIPADAELRAEVASLLAHDDPAGSTQSLPGSFVVETEERANRPQRIGQYEIISRIASRTWPRRSPRPTS